MRAAAIGVIADGFFAAAAEGTPKVLAALSNTQLTTIQLKNRSIPVMFADISSQDAFQKFLASNKIRNGQLVIQYLNKILKRQAPKPTVPGVI